MKPTSSVFNGIGFVFLVIVSCAFIAKIVWDKLKGRAYDASLTPVLMIAACLWLGFASRMLQEGWLMWTLLLAQFVLIVLVIQKSWPALKKMTRG